MKNLFLRQWCYVHVARAISEHLLITNEEQAKKKTLKFLEIQEAGRVTEKQISCCGSNPITQATG